MVVCVYGLYAIDRGMMIGTPKYAGGMQLAMSMTLGVDEPM